MKQSTFTLFLFVIAALTACQKDAVMSVSQMQAVPKTKARFKTFNKYAINTAVTGFIKVVLAKDSVNKDDILIMFNPNTSPAFVFNEDARYFQGYGLVSFSSLSSEGVPLTIDKRPFPSTSATIALNVDATKSDVYTLNLTAINSIPANYDIWLMDNYKKDSLDFRHNPAYAFNLNKADSASFGGNRFTLVIRQNQALAVHLLDFMAFKSNGGTQFNWKTENEGVSTAFTIEKSMDKGNTFSQLANINSSGTGHYSFFDKTHGYGEARYRLRVVSPDSQVIYSKIVSPMDDDPNHHSRTDLFFSKLPVFHNK